MAIETPARIAVLGAGPIGLEAALYARYLGYEVEVFERGRVADHVARWGHVRMFTPFGLNRSSLGLAALRAQDPNWQRPADDALLTGREYIDRYLLPLAQSDLLADGLREQTEVVAVGRDGLAKADLGGPDQRDQREEPDLRLLVRGTNPADHDRQRLITFDAVIDATGTYSWPNWLGPGGLPAVGELEARRHIDFGVPDVLGTRRDQFASRNILLVGDGLPAATNLLALAELAAHSPDTWITWVRRAPAVAQAAGQAGSLAECERVLAAAERLAASDANHVTSHSNTAVEEIAWHEDLGRFTVRLAGQSAGPLEFDRVIAAVGCRPDLGLFRELQVDTCRTSEAPQALATALAGMPTLGTDLAPPFTAEMLCTTEPDFYVLGAKSYGRDGRFLIAHGLQQIRALFTLIGDRENLDLYSSMNGLC